MIRSEDGDNNTDHQICSDACESITMTPDIWRVSHFVESNGVHVVNGQSINAIGIGNINNLENCQVMV